MIGFDAVVAQQGEAVGEQLAGSDVEVARGQGGFRETVAVDEDRARDDLDGFAGQSDDPFDDVLGSEAGDDDIAARGEGIAVGLFTDEKQVSGQEGRGHAVAVDDDPADVGFGPGDEGEGEEAEDEPGAGALGWGGAEGVLGGVGMGWGRGLGAVWVRLGVGVGVGAWEVARSGEPGP